MYALVLDVHESLSVGVSEVGLMRGSEVDLCLVEGVLYLVGEDAGGEAGYELADLVLVGGLEHVVVDEQVVPQEGQLLTHVAEKTTDCSRKGYG